MNLPASSLSALPKSMEDYYNRRQETERLFTGIGRLELLRTQELLLRYLPAPPAVVLDVGGGPGVYAYWLAQAGYQVHLVDAVPLHVAQAEEAAAQHQPACALASIQLGDARRLSQPDACADAVLLFGPLYHLTRRGDRLAALREASRVLRPGGVLLAVGISRYASTHVSLIRWWLEDPAIRQMIKRELADGQHRPPPDWPGLFTTAYFHRPDELEAELVDTGFTHRATLAVEGPGWLAPDFDEHWSQPQAREHLLTVVRWLEAETAILGISPHLLAVAHKSG